MGRFAWLALAVLVACGGKKDGDGQEGTPCGDDLTCADGEFCLGFLAAGASTGEEEYSCEPLPEGCESFDHMCFDDPDVCVEDWASEVCGPNTFGSGCVAFGGSQEAYCQEAATSSR